MLAINPDPARWDGVLLPFAVPDLPLVIRDVWAGRRKVREVTMAQATLTDGQMLLAVNDFFVGTRGHVSPATRSRTGTCTSGSLQAG